MGRGEARRTRWRTCILGVIGFLALACGGHSSRTGVQIRVLPDETATPVHAGSGVAVVTQAPPPAVSLTGSFRIAATTDQVGVLTPILQALAREDPKLHLSLVPVADAEAIARSGADLGVTVVLPGARVREGGNVIGRKSIAIALPLTLSPDDLTLPQAVDLLCGAVTDWGQVGGARRAVRLAFADPASLAAIGNLTGNTSQKPLVTRVDSAAVLLAETDAGVDEAAIVPWPSPRIRTKALRIDGRFPGDADYSLAVHTVIFPLRKESGALLEQLAPALEARLAPLRSGTVTIDAMGDLMLGRGVAVQVQRNGPQWPFARVTNRLRSADLRFGNLELALTDRGTQVRKDYTFRAPPSSVDALSGAGINIVDLANNHILDYGPQGLTDTLGALARGAIAHVGAGIDPEWAHAPALFEVNGVRIAWLAYANVPDDGVTGFVARSLEAGTGRPGVAWGLPDAIRRDVQNARKQSDLVIVALHAGFEYTAEANSIQKDLAHAAIDSGAALVLGAHPHVLQGIEFYHGGVVAYSLGNFVFDLDDADLAQYGLPSVLTVILRVALDSSGVTGLEVYPAIINRTDFRPEPVVGDAARPVFDRLYRLTDALNHRTP